MEEGKEKTDGYNSSDREEIHSKAVRAGKRTYFFDVKATRRNDYYLTITESKKRYHKDGRFFYEKHKIFLYKEDFDKFLDGFTESVDFIKEANPQQIDLEPIVEEQEEKETQSFTNVEFEDLEKVEETSGTEAPKD